jgi:hypothetical protein
LDQVACSQALRASAKISAAAPMGCWRAFR